MCKHFLEIILSKTVWMIDFYKWNSGKVNISIETSDSFFFSSSLIRTNRCYFVDFLFLRIFLSFPLNSIRLLNEKKNPLPEEVDQITKGVFWFIFSCDEKYELYTGSWWRKKKITYLSMILSNNFLEIHSLSHTK